MIKKNIFNCFLIVAFFQSYLFPFSNNVFGTLLDSKTKNPISNANIFIDNNEVGAASDNDGYFYLSFLNNIDSSINLNIQVIGYEKKTIVVELVTDRIDLGKIYLKSISIDLETVKVHSHDHGSSQISDIVISGGKLKENLKGNIASTLSNQPNIGINSMGYVTSKPVLRGFSGDRFLLTKDGNETGDLSQSAIDHVITLDMTEVNDIEIIRGPRSLLYGPNAIGGVMNTTIAGNPKFRVNKISSKITFGSESFNQGYYGNIFFYIPIKNNQLNISLNNRTNDDQDSPIGILKNTSSHTTNYKIGFTSYMKDRYLNLIAENYTMDYGIPPSPIGHVDGVDINLFSNSLQINYHQDLLLENIENLDVKFNVIDYEHQEHLTDENQMSDLSDPHVILGKKTYNVKLELSSENLIVGAELSKKEFNAEEYYYTPKTNERFLSFYGFHETKLRKLDIDFLSSFRLGYLEVSPDKDYQHDNFTPDQIKDRSFESTSLSFGLRKKIKKIEINSWIMQTMRPPRVEELYSDGPHLGSYAYEIGNPGLGIEKIYGIENSISYSNNSLNLSLVTFYNDSPNFFQMTQDFNCEQLESWTESQWLTLGHPCAEDNLGYPVDGIEYGEGSDGWLYVYSSKGYDVVIKGIEASLGYSLNDFELDYYFSLTRGDNKTLQLPLSYMNPTKQILNLGYSKNLMNYKVRFINIHKQDRLGEFETYTPGAFLVDLIFSYSYNKQDISIQLNNLFDEEYYNHLSKIKDSMPEAGRNIVFSYKIFF